MYTTYVLENMHRRIHIGHTKDLNDRLQMHNDVSEGKMRFHKTTYKKGPWHVIYEKSFDTRVESRRYEQFLKTGKGREFLSAYLSTERARRGE